MPASNSASLSEFFTGDKYFEIPVYQRNYSWETEHVNDLWNDLVEAIEMDRDHYIGPFLLMTEENEEDPTRKIIDGQQRLTTLTILLFELQEALERHDKSDLARRIRGEYIAQYGKQKLTLGGEDEEFFQEKIMQRVFDASADSRVSVPLEHLETNSPSQRRLKDAKEEIRENLQEVPPSEVWGSPVEFYEAMYQRVKSLQLLSHAVHSRSEAARIFQTVNDRGKDLTDLEITKSYLMHLVSVLEDGDMADSLIETIQSKFNNIYRHVENIDSGPGEDQIQRYHFIIWNTEWGTGYNDRHYQNHLDHVKQHYRRVEDVEEIMDYVDELTRMFELMDDFCNYECESNHFGTDVGIQCQFRNLFLVGRLGNFYPLILAAYNEYRHGDVSEEEFLALLETIETFIVRTYLIEQKNADTARTKVYPLARKLYYHGKDVSPDSVSTKSIDDVIARLEKEVNNYCDDDDLESTLIESEVYEYYKGRRKELRLLLYVYEHHLEENEEEMYFDPEDVGSNKEDRFWVEHVWPQTPGDKFTEEEQLLIREHRHRLGNLALMTSEDDIVMGNDPFDQKKAKFNGSKFRMLEEIFSNSEWGVDRISEREEKIVRVIKNRWPDAYSTDSQSVTVVQETVD